MGEKNNDTFYVGVGDYSRAIWFACGRWLFGQKTQLGECQGSLQSQDATSCVTNAKWMYWNGITWNTADIDAIHVNGPAGNAFSKIGPKTCEAH